MPVQPFKKQNDLLLEEKAIKLYREGLTTRKVGEAIGRSHQWVALRVKKLSTLDTDLQGSKIKVTKRS